MLSANPGAHAVHDFPILEYLPSFLAPWRAHGKKLHEFEMQLYTSLASTVKKQMAAGEHPECIMRCKLPILLALAQKIEIHCHADLLDGAKQFEMDDEDVLYLVCGFSLSRHRLQTDIGEGRNAI